MGYGASTFASMSTLPRDPLNSSLRECLHSVSPAETESHEPRLSPASRSSTTTSTTTRQQTSICQPLDDASLTSHSKPACTASTIPKGLPVRSQMRLKRSYWPVDALSRCVAQTQIGELWLVGGSRFFPSRILAWMALDQAELFDHVCSTHHAVHPQLEAECTTGTEALHTMSTLTAHKGIDLPLWSSSLSSPRTPSQFIVDSRPPSAACRIPITA